MKEPNPNSKRNQPNLGENDSQFTADKMAGRLGGIHITGAQTTAQEKYHASQGHGFAAEDGNTFIDKLFGHKAKVVGGDNAKNGPDRLVDGQYIQSKYCNTGKGCIDSCFKDGKFRYMRDGHPMQIEVPRDKYDAALHAMEDRVRNGEIPGITDPGQAKDIVRKGHLTYKQARNLARAGTIESLTWDVTTGLVSASCAFGLTAAVSFASAIWNGKSVKFALRQAGVAGLQVGGQTLVTYVAVAQLTKCGLNSALRPATEAVVKMMGSKAYTTLAYAFRSGAPLRGAAAMSSAAKILRGNIITAVVTIMVLSSVDISKYARRRMSGKQLTKNVINTTVTVGGGVAGGLAGAAAAAKAGALMGTTILPGVGTVLGGIVGGLVGSAIACTISKKATKKLIGKDDAEEMAEILQKHFVELASEYMLVSEKEANRCIDELRHALNGGKRLEDMFASKDRDDFARKLIEPIMEKVSKQRKHVSLPNTDSMIYELGKFIDEKSNTPEQDNETEQTAVELNEADRDQSTAPSPSKQPSSPMDSAVRTMNGIEALGNDLEEANERTELIRKEAEQNIATYYEEMRGVLIKTLKKVFDKEQPNKAEIRAETEREEKQQDERLDNLRSKLQTW